MAALAVSGCSSPVDSTVKLQDAATKRLGDFINKEMLARHIPGLTACLISRSELLWQQSFGFADLVAQMPMSADHVQNIASISKTFVTVAAMQQVQAGKLNLDDDVNEYLPYSIRNPHHPDVPVTPRMLMYHTSALRDGLVYANYYRCGDPSMSLGEWIKDYFSSGGRFYSADENFHAWQPGERYDYCNTSFGLLGHLVEQVSGQSLPDYCEERLFAPLGMSNTAWMVADVDDRPTTTPYTWVEQQTARGPSWGGVPLGVITADGPTLMQPLEDGYVANCLYNHPNYPDGFLRTSLNDLRLWAGLWLGDGSADGLQILQPETTQQMFTGHRLSESYDGRQGLTWHRDGELEGEFPWGHDGSDPGVSTSLKLIRERGLAAIVMTNTNGVSPSDFANEILREALQAI